MTLWERTGSPVLPDQFGEVPETLKSYSEGHSQRSLLYYTSRPRLGEDVSEKLLDFSRMLSWKVA